MMLTVFTWVNNVNDVHIVKGLTWGRSTRAGIRPTQGPTGRSCSSSGCASTACGRKNPELGLVGTPRTCLSGRVILVWQYWESFEKLAAYARANDRVHLPAWRAFNQKVRDNGSVGIFHETIVLSDANVETVYGNMPAFGLAAVTGAVPAGRRGQTARARLTGDSTEVPAVDPY
jgi:hypothetical protein